MNLIASNMKRIIQEKGLKQAYVAKRAGMSAAAFSNMLNDRKVIKADMVPVLSKALEVEPNDLFIYNSRERRVQGEDSHSL